MNTKRKLLSGGNPQIPKGYGEGPVRDWLDAVPDTGPGGWKHGVCRRIDAIVSEEVPGVMKAVKWNSPLYGCEEDRYFLSFHCFDNYVKIAFHTGSALDPLPPVGSKQKAVRYLHATEGGPELDAQFADWVRQAAALPGEKM